MLNKKTRKPNKAWELLLRFGESGGRITKDEIGRGRIDATKKQIQILNRTLCSFFGCKAPAIIADQNRIGNKYSKNDGWVAVFSVGRRSM